MQKLLVGRFVQRTLLGLLTLCAVMTAGSAWSQTQFWVSVGSFRELAGAERVRDAAAAKLSESFAITPADTARGYYFRVLAGPYLGREAAQEAVGRAQAAGFADAWLLAQGAGIATVGSGARASQSSDASFPGSDATGPESLPTIYPLPPRRPDQGQAPGTESTWKSGLPAGGTERQPDRQPPPTLIEQAPENFNLNKLRRDAQARPPPGGPAHGAVSVAPNPAAKPKIGAPIHPPRFSHQRLNIKIDGTLDEAEWQQATPITDFVAIEPDSLLPGDKRTEMRMFYTERGLYVGFDMEQPADDLVKWLSRRDEGGLNRDNVGVTLDTSGDGRYGYWISLALGDNQTDGTILPERQFSRDWDGAWYGSTTQTADGWSAEAFIPWSQTAMPKRSGERLMGLYVSRKYAARDERWAYPALPPTKPQFMSALQPIVLRDVNPKQQWSLYPYLSVTADEIDDRVRYDGGAEIFWRPSTNFQATASINPDFGNVEADDVVVNLSAFETFFSERRLFFLEGQEIFNTSPRADSFSNREPTTIVNTRRIGGRPRAPSVPPGVRVSAAELGQPTELIGAAKVTGQIGSVRYGVMGAFEDEVKFDVGPANYQQDGSDYTAARIIYEDRGAKTYRALGFIATAVTHPERDAYVVGSDVHYLSAGGKWKVDGQLLYTDIDDTQATEDSGKGYGGFVDFVYTQRRGLRYKLGLSSFSDKLDINDFGFLRRNDAHNLQLGLDWQGVAGGWIRDFSISPFLQYEVNGDNRMTRLGMGSRNDFTLPNLGKLEVETTFFPKRFEDRNSFGNGTYRIQERPRLSLGYESNEADSLSYSASITYMGEDAGGEFFQGKVGLAWRPIDRMNLSASLSYSDRHGWLLHQEDANFTAFDADVWQPQLDFEYFFSAKQQFRVALQWVGIRADESEFYEIPNRPGSLRRVNKPAGPSDNFRLSQLSFQVRYRWQIAPLSDLFVVYAKSAAQAPALDELSDLFDNAWDHPDSEQLVVKLRYRLGT